MTVNKPIVHAFKFYHNDEETTFNDDLQFYLTRGYVFSGKDMFIMARPIARKLSKYAMDEDYEYQQDEIDTWFCYFAAGELHRFTEIAPFKTKYILYHRQEKDDLDRWYSWEQFERLVRITNGKQKSQKT